MKSNPFLDRPTEIARSKAYTTMSIDSGKARSHTWWRRLVENGPWGPDIGFRVTPPPPEAIKGIAKLFHTSPNRVREMIAADWYEVPPRSDVSPRALNLSHVLDTLSDEDAKLVETVACRLAKGAGQR